MLRPETLERYDQVMTKKRKRWAETGMIDGESELTVEHIKTLRSKSQKKSKNVITSD